MGAEREVQYECVGSCIIHIDFAHQLTADSDSLVVRSGFRVSGKDSLRHELLASSSSRGTGNVLKRGKPCAEHQPSEARPAGVLPKGSAKSLTVCR